MTNRTKLRRDYSNLKRKILTRIVSVTLLAITIAIAYSWLRVSGSGSKYDLVITEGSTMFSVNAFGLFPLIFRKNPGFFLVLVLAFLALLQLFVYWLLKYFGEINSGLDKLLEEADGDITLSPELSSLERKLNAVKAALKQRKENAEQAEQRKNDLVVYLAHDLKTPLTSIIGYLTLCSEVPQMPLAQREKAIGITLEKAFQLEQLIDEFFEITRFNLQTIVLNKSETNLSLMLEQIADEFHPVLASQNKRAVVHVPEELTIWADADKLARVFTNILKNALSYSYENSIINISGASQDETISISFTNKGVPIPANQLETIFERFYRLDSSRSSGTGGSGLGLAIAKEIISAHGGMITVESDVERTVFRVILPTTQEVEIQMPS